MTAGRRLRGLGGALVFALLAGSTVVAAPAAAATDDWTVSGPLATATASAGPTAKLHHDRATGTVTIGVTRAGRTVLEPSPLGIVTEQVDLSSGLRPLGRSERRGDGRPPPPPRKPLGRTPHPPRSPLRFARAG